MKTDTGIIIFLLFVIGIMLWHALEEITDLLRRIANINSLSCDRLGHIETEVSLIERKFRKGEKTDARFEDIWGKIMDSATDDDREKGGERK